MTTRAIAVETGRTMYLTTVQPAGISHVTGKPTAVLKPAKANHKLSDRSAGVWTKGAYVGLPLYSLTLEERATCETTCPLWTACYGNHMRYATRFEPGESLEDLLESELYSLDRKHPHGYSVRLHVLGDFYSVSYVEFWARMLDEHPLLHVFGYTHRLGEIAQAVDSMCESHHGRANILQSDGLSESRPSALVRGKHSLAETLPVCPQQTGQASGCLDCGLCTLPAIRGVQFLEH